MALEIQINLWGPLKYCEIKMQATLVASPLNHYAEGPFRPHGLRFIPETWVTLSPNHEGFRCGSLGCAASSEHAGAVLSRAYCAWTPADLSRGEKAGELPLAFISSARKRASRASP